MSKTKKLSISTTHEETVWGWIYLFLYLLILPLLVQTGNRLLAAPLSDAALNFLFYSINFISVCIIFRKFLKKSLVFLKLRFGYTLQSALFGFVLYNIGTIALSFLLQRLYPGFGNVNDGYITAMTAENYSLMAIGTVFLVPVAEEVLFRGLLFQGLYNRSRAAAYIVSTLAFCAIHIKNYVGTYDPLLLLLCFIQYIPAGLALAWAYARADTVAAPILIHMSINALGVAVR